MKSLMSRRPPGRRSCGRAPIAAPASSAPRASSVSRMPVSLGARSHRTTLARPVESAAQLLDDGRIAHVSGEGDDPIRPERLEPGEIEADHATARADPLGRHLHPGTWPGSQVDDQVSRAQQPEAIVELDQLVGASRPIPRGPGATVVGVLSIIRRRPRRAPSHCSATAGWSVSGGRSAGIRIRKAAASELARPGTRSVHPCPATAGTDRARRGRCR